MIRMKFVGIAVVAALAAVGSTVSVLTLSAQNPPTATPQTLSTVVAQHESAIGADVTYCDTRTDGISVQGVGVVTIPANIGVVELGVDVTADPLIEARSTAADAMESILDAVKEQGVTDDRITTTRLSIRPERTWIEEEFTLEDGSTGRRSRDVIIGYRVSNRVRIEIDVADASDDGDTDILSAVIDAAATAGGDHVRIDSIYFTADQTSENLDEARMLAVQDALHRANLYAESFGVEVGVLTSATEGFTSTPVYGDAAVVRVESASFDGPSTPISAGDVEVRASLTAKFAITQPGCVDRVAMNADDGTE